MAIYNNDRDPNDIMWEQQNNPFINDAYDEESKLYNQFLDEVINHDYSHMFSDDDRAWRAGNQSEKHIKEKLHALITICRYDAEELLEECISQRDEQYTDGLTHKTIRNWFKPYVEKTHNINVKPYTKAAFEEKDGMYYVGDKFEVDGDGWVSEEQLELLLLEFNNGVK